MSVVVPVFDPGPALDDLIASVDRQALAPTEFEVILCDDGSDEPTRQRLAHIARDRPNVRVLNLAHTGWPGTPRNHGIAAAVGEYVYFVDQDDYLFDAALRNLCDYADQHASDVVVGKEVGIGRSLPRRIFRRDIPRATLGEDPLLELLTPHKLFRTSFLRTHDIRFPDGRVRLEDHLFVMRAYFAAETISVLASAPCYAWVKHPGSASSSRIDPDTYFPHLEAVLDVVEEHTEPGELRNTLLRHWLRGKILKRLSGRQMLGYPDDYRARLLDVVTPLVQRRFGPGVDDGLAFPHRLRAALVRAGRRDDLLQLARFESELVCRAAATSIRWSRGGGLHLTLRVRITHDGEDAISIASPDSAAASIAGSLPAPLEDLSSTVFHPATDLRGDRVDLYLRHGADGAERRIAGRRSGDLASFDVSIDPLRMFPRNNHSRGGRLILRVHRAGWSFEVPLTADSATVAHVGPSPILAGRPFVLATTGEDVEVRRDGSAGGLKDFAGRAVRRARALARRR